MIKWLKSLHPIKWLKEKKPKAYAALKVAMIVFLSQFLLDALGFIGDIREWATGEAVVFPSLAPLGKAGVAAICSAAAGLVSYVLNTIRPSSAPSYTSPPAG